jgi:prevent-host-death family protein
MTKTIPLAEAKKRFSALIKDVEEKFDRFTITKNGVERAVILSNEEYEGLLETLDILSCQEERDAIKRAKEQIKKGRTLSLATLKKKYDLE